MCAPKELEMEEPSIWRSSSQSTGGTTLIGDNTLASPLSPAGPWTDAKPSPLIFTGPDNKQWIDLDIISPKLIKELRRQNAWSGAENSSSLAKGAAKIKAWARQSKLGIDIRLRRKVDDRHDEVTDIQLIPDFIPSKHPGLKEQPELAELPEDDVVELADTSVMQELPVLPNVLHEPFSRVGSPSTVSEYLPRYEAFVPGSTPTEVTLSDDDQSWHSTPHPENSEHAQSRAEDVVNGIDRVNRPPSPASSIVRTPTRGLSVSIPISQTPNADHYLNDNHSGRQQSPIKLRDAIGRKFVFPWAISRTWEGIDGLIKQAFTHANHMSDLVQEGHYDLVGPDGTVFQPDTWEALVQPGLSVTMQMRQKPATEEPKSPTSLQALEAGLMEANKRLEEERKAREEFARLIEEIKTSRTHTEGDGANVAKPDSSDRPEIASDDQTGSLLRGLRVADKKIYETETDVEPQSSSSSMRKPSISVGKNKKGKPLPKRKRINPRNVSNEHLLRTLSNKNAVNDSDEESTLFRRQTVPKKMTHNSDPEEIWYALLNAQKKIIGAEHPLVFQAMHEFALSRLKQHKSCSDDVLGALQASKLEASKTLGEVHPRVTAYTADLQLLHTLMMKRAGLDEASSAVDASRTENSASTTPEGQDKDQIVDLNSERADAANSPVSDNPILHVEESQIGASAGSMSQLPISPVTGGTPSFTPAQPQPGLSSLQTTLPPSSKDPTPPPDATNPWYNTYRPPHQPQNDAVVLGGLVVAAMASMVTNAASWIARNYGPEPAVEHGKVRVRWTCSCGMNLQDDFVEKRRGAARELEAYLNRPRMHGDAGSPTSSTGTVPSRVFTNSTGRTPTTQTTFSSFGPGGYSPVETKGPRLDTGFSGLPQWQPLAEPPWLLTCASEDRYTPKLAHLDMSRHKITSDRDLAMALRGHYFHINRRWWRRLKLRGLTTIEFVQFEVHQNRFADFRKCPDVPGIGSTDYDFEPAELMPPVGSNYLLHLFKHPEDYDGELITYLRSPKKHNGRLHLGVGWGINLVEGFLPSRVWLLLGGFFASGSLIFGTVWAYKMQDVQGAFGVAAWIMTLAGLAIGYLQSCLG